VNRGSRLKYVVAMIGIAVVVGAVSLSATQDNLLKKHTETITAKDGSKYTIDMVLIPGGEFMMGSPVGEACRAENEGPQHEVKLDPFYMCTTETTLELFMVYYQETGTAKKDFIEVQEDKKNEEVARDGVNAITGPTPVYGDMTMGYSKKHPAIGMTWYNATTFCRWLSQKTGKTYRLPTEAEWEYASRAGSTRVFGVCDSADGLKDYAWYAETADFEPHAVATKKPNAYGLYDMQGNVREWVQDFYSPTAYADAAQDSLNPTGPTDGKVHVARGGYYDSPAKDLRCAARAFEEPEWRMNDPQIPKSRWWLPQIDFVGFRVVCSAPKDEKK
jgi:sulfatase modifying factor 1